MTFEEDELILFAVYGYALKIQGKFEAIRCPNIANCSLLKKKETNAKIANIGAKPVLNGH